MVDNVGQPALIHGCPGVGLDKPGKDLASNTGRERSACLVGGGWGRVVDGGRLCVALGFSACFSLASRAS